MSLGDLTRWSRHMTSCDFNIFSGDKVINVEGV